MALYHSVAAGECISSIAHRFGFAPATLWDHPQNAALRSARANPDVLAPGDLVFIPDRRARATDAAVDARHRYRVRGVPARLRLQLLEDDEPLAAQPFELVVDGGLVLRGVTDDAGRIDVAIPPNARAGRLVVGEGPSAATHELRLGRLDPVEDPAGLRARLTNLGYGVGDDPTPALRRFQRDHDVPETGLPDAPTLQALLAAHGS